MRLLMVMTFIAAASGPAAQAAHPVAAQIINGATLTVLAPEVQVSLQGGALGVARDGQTLAPGDYVRTGSAGVALLTFFDGSETQLTSDTQVELDTATRGGPITEFQSNGTTANRVVGASRNGGFDVDSAPAAAIVRGTTFVVTVRGLQPTAGFGCGRTDL